MKPSEIADWICDCIGASEADGHQQFEEGSSWNSDDGSPEIVSQSGSEIVVNTPDGQEFRILIKRKRNRRQ